MLDSMDVMLYALVLGQVQREMHLSPAMSGAMMSATLVSAAVGGFGFGWFADRFGRMRALTLSILVYSVSTAICGLTHTAGSSWPAASFSASAWAVSGPPARRWWPNPGPHYIAAKRSHWYKVLGRWLRAGRCVGRCNHAALRLACRLLCRHRSGADHAMVSTPPEGARSLAAACHRRASPSANSFAALSAAMYSSAPP